MQSYSTTKKTYKRYFNIGGSLILPLFIISCFTGFLNPEIYRGITFIAIGFPFLFIAAFLWVLLAFSFFYCGKWWIFIVLLPGFYNLSNTYPFRIPSDFNQTKENRSLRILSWNVNEFLFSKPGAGSNAWMREQKAMLNFIKKTDADVLCFQDYIISPGYAERDVTRFISDSLGYKHFIFTADGKDYGTIIFSKYPIIDSGRKKYSLKIHPESLAYADIQFQHQTIRIFTTHFRSMFLHHNRLSPENLGDLKYVKEDTALLFNTNRLERMEYFDRVHSQQAAMVKQVFEQTNIPFIFCADLNAVPTSYVYQQLRKQTKDAFLEAGSGIKGTYKSVKSLFRIDVIFTSKNLKTKQFYCPTLNLSDHYPLVADISLSN